MLRASAVSAAVLCAAWAAPGRLAGQADTAADTLRRFTLAPATISVTRLPLEHARTPFAVHRVTGEQIHAARPTWGLDEALFSVPGVFVANRYNFSLDQRLSIRGFGSRAAFAVRGVKILLDGIPQTLPDGQGQLTNLDLGTAERIEVLRGSSSALYGNASGGVISISSGDAPVPGRLVQTLRLAAGSFDRDLERTWSKWQATTRARVGRAGAAQLSLSRLAYEGERDHSAADLRSLNARLRLPLGADWRLSASADAGVQPRADNPGALTLAELQANRDSAPAINLTTRAGKDVTQLQAGVTAAGRLPSGTEPSLTVFGLTRDLENPTTFAYIRIDRLVYGARAAVTQPLPLGGRPHRLTVGADVQHQRDDRQNFGNAGGEPDTSRLLDQLERVTEVGPFVQSALEISPRWTLTTGLRYDRVAFRVADRLVSETNPDDSGERVMGALSGSVGVALNPADLITVYATVGSSFETPTTTELANRPNGAGGFNDALGPQRAWSYELGARGAWWSLAVFHADVTDELISYEVPGVPQRRFFRNAGSARHRGLELGASRALPGGVTATLAWTFADYRYRAYRFTPEGGGPEVVLDGRELPGIPRHHLRALLRANPGWARGGWSEIETTHASGVLVDDTLPTRTRPWWHTNLRLGWDGNAGAVAVSPFVAVSNVFNRHYVGSVVINAARGRYYEPAPGRHLYLGVVLRATVN